MSETSEGACPNLACQAGYVGSVGCATCNSAPRCAVCRVAGARDCLRVGCPTTDRGVPIGKHGPYGTHTAPDGSRANQIPVESPRVEPDAWAIEDGRDELITFYAEKKTAERICDEFNDAGIYKPYSLVPLYRVPEKNGGETP